MSAALDGLRAMRARLTEPRAWTQGAYARNRSGAAIYRATAKTAVAWDLIGACRCLPRDEMIAAYDALCRIQGDLRGFADAPTTTHADVLALLDAAIAAEASQ